MADDKKPAAFFRQVPVDVARFEALKQGAVIVRAGEAFQVSGDSPRESCWNIYRIDDDVIDVWDGPSATLIRYYVPTTRKTYPRLPERFWPFA